MAYYNVHNLLWVYSEYRPVIPDSFLLKGKRYTKPDLIFLVRDDFRIAGKLIQIAPNVVHDPVSGWTIFRLKIFGTVMKYGIKRLFEHKTVVQCNRNFLKLGRKLKIPISGIFPFHHLCKMAVQIKLLQKHHSFIIGSHLDIGDNSVFLASYGGMGKTCAWLTSDRRRFFSDDTFISDGKRNLSFPIPIRVRDRKPTIFTKERFIDPGKLDINDEMAFTHGALLFSGKESKDKISTDEFRSGVSNINRKILPFEADTMLSACFTVNAKDIGEFRKIESRIIKKLVSGLDTYKVTWKYSHITDIWRRE